MAEQTMPIKDCQDDGSSGRQWFIVIRLSEEELYAKRSEVVQEAIRIAKLKRRQEYIVESIGLAIEGKEDNWKLKSSSEIGISRSDCTKCIQEAATAGLARLIKRDCPPNLLPDTNESYTMKNTFQNQEVSTHKKVFLSNDSGTWSRQQIEICHSWDPIKSTPLSSSHQIFLRKLRKSLSVGDSPCFVIATNVQLSQDPMKPVIQDEVYSESQGVASDLFREVAKKAKERAIRVAKPEYVHRITDGCVCASCQTASPRQTEESRTISRPGMSQKVALSKAAVERDHGHKCNEDSMGTRQVH
jgi:hypothetical protein